MENGFTQHHSKGLFTFYREQAEHSKIIKGFRKANKNGGEKHSNRHYVSLSAYETKNRREDLYASKELEPKPKAQTYRYQQPSEDAIKKPVSTLKHVFEPRIIQKSSRKNAYQIQLIGVRNRINRSEIESYLKKQTLIKTGKGELVGELSARQLPANQIKQLFLPKKEHYAKIHALRKSPLKLNAITAHCIEPQQTQRQAMINENCLIKGEKQKSAQISAKKIRNMKKQSIDSRQVFKDFRDFLQIRKNKLQNGTLIEQIKLKRDLPTLKLNEVVRTATNQAFFSQFNDSRLISLNDEPASSNPQP